MQNWPLFSAIDDSDPAQSAQGLQSHAPAPTGQAGGNVAGGQQQQGQTKTTPSSGAL